MRGELAIAEEDWDSTASAYRYVLGHLEHPLYAYALYRTAETQERLGAKTAWIGPRAAPIDS